MQESRGKFESQFFKLISEDLAEESMSVGGGALGPAAQGGKYLRKRKIKRSEV